MPDRAQELIDAAGGQPPGSLRAELANAMVGLKKRHYGRGPEAAKAYVEDDYIFVVLEGGLTRSEETLLADGKADLVRQYRLAFQETVAPDRDRRGRGAHRPAGDRLPQPGRLRPDARLRDLRACTGELTAVHILSAKRRSWIGQG